jgi:hypothetical protein
MRAGSIIVLLLSIGVYFFLYLENMTDNTAESFYDLKALDYRGKEVDFSKYKGKVRAT